MPQVQYYLLYVFRLRKFKQTFISLDLLRYIPVETRGQSQKDQQVTAGNGDSTYSQSHNVHPSTTTSNILCYDATAPL